MVAKKVLDGQVSIVWGKEDGGGRRQSATSEYQQIKRLLMWGGNEPFGRQYTNHTIGLADERSGWLLIQ